MEETVKRLTQEVALLREDVNTRFDVIDDHFVQLASELRQQLTAFQANIISAVMNSKKPAVES